MSRYRAVFIDLDGTLLSNRKRHVSGRDRAAVRAARGAGLRVYLNTGRSVGGTVASFAQLGADSPVFCYNGAVVHDPKAGRDLVHVTLPDGVVDQVFVHADACDLPVFCFHEDQILTHEHPDTAHGTVVERMKLAGVQVRPSRDDLPRCQVTKVWVLGTEPEAQALMEQTSTLEVRWVSPLVSVVFLGAPEDRVLLSGTGAVAMKRSALEYVARTEGFELSEMVAIGDHDNDLEALVAAGLGVAIQGSASPVLAAADRIIGPPETDSVAALLEELAGMSPDS